MSDLLKIKTNDLKTKSLEQLTDMRQSCKKFLVDERMNVLSGNNPAKLKTVKRVLARVETFATQLRAKNVVKKK